MLKFLYIYIIITLTILARMKRLKLSLSTTWNVYIYIFTVLVGCTNYTVLSEPDRHTSYGRGGNSDASLVPGWYRFQSGSYTKMLDYCVSHHRCRTDITGWLNGLHPSLEEGIVNRQACFHGYYNCCYRRVQIQVRRCEGFYVYYLNPSPAGSFRYCAIA